MTVEKFESLSMTLSLFNVTPKVPVMPRLQKQNYMYDLAYTCGTVKCIVNTTLYIVIIIVMGSHITRMTMKSLIKYLVPFLLVIQMKAEITYTP